MEGRNLFKSWVSLACLPLSLSLLGATTRKAVASMSSLAQPMEYSLAPVTVPFSPQNRQICSPNIADIEPLIPQLLRDLPSYTNRVVQRSRLRGDRSISTYVLTAGRPEFEPLPLGPGRLTAGRFTNAPVDDPKQVFITTLERHYRTGRIVELQQFYWLFLTKTNSGWRLAMAYSRTGIHPLDQPPSPPRDSNDGAIAQAVRLWLRDCQAQPLRSP